jgi:flagellum-specific ATP synthase
LAGRYPAVDPLASVSRLATKVLEPVAVDLARRARAALAAAESVRDLVEVGAYVPGTNLDADRGLALAPALIELCRQRVEDIAPIEETFRAMAQIMASVPEPVGAMR